MVEWTDVRYPSYNYKNLGASYQHRQLTYSPQVAHKAHTHKQQQWHLSSLRTPRETSNNALNPVPSSKVAKSDKTGSTRASRMPARRQELTLCVCDTRVKSSECTLRAFSLSRATRMPTRLVTSWIRSLTRKKVCWPVSTCLEFLFYTESSISTLRSGFNLPGVH